MEMGTAQGLIIDEEDYSFGKKGKGKCGKFESIRSSLGS
jgi:hypothetical protein